jgi:oligopeptide transport system ATP-binding protein
MTMPAAANTTARRQPDTGERLLEVRDLTVSFHSGRGQSLAVDSVSFEISRGETVGLVGESGCGKSTTALAVLRLLPPRVAQTSGQILFAGTDLLHLPSNEMRHVRGGRIGFVSQDAMTGLNPLMTIGNQVAESLRIHAQMARREATREAVELLARVGIPLAAERIDDFPHQFSGGMRQRVMIAMAIACKPDLIIADEPTTALDVTIQAQILELLASLSEDYGTAVLLITHNFGITARLCDRVNVMYAGRLVEKGATTTVFKNPQMPYTQALMRCIPRVDDERNRALRTIRGLPPRLTRATGRCTFAPRCEFAQQICREHEPELTPRDGTDHVARCWGTEAGGWLA